MQQGYEIPQEATGRIVCANCHLSNKYEDNEVPPQGSNIVLEADILTSCNKSMKQVLANVIRRALNTLNVGSTFYFPIGYLLPRVIIPISMHFLYIPVQL